MFTKSLKLIVEEPKDRHEFSFLNESVEMPDGSKEKRYYIEGPFTEANSRNRNNRIYPLEEMVQQINEFNEKFVLQHRATGELEHPEYPNLNAEKACHLITSLKQDGNVFYGKSKILSTPTGKIVESLLRDGVQLGVSSRSLGCLDESTGIVTDFQLCTFDIVHDPSCQKAFVNGILESKDWICNYNEKFVEQYESFDKKLAKLPKKDVEKYLLDAVMDFMKKM